MRNLSGLSKRWPKRTLAERFWQKVDCRELAECWPWTARKIATGYGQFQVRKGLWKYAHRMAYELTQGSFDSRWHILHSCDNPPCCNPAHLRRGTHQENMAEMKAKGRHKKRRRSQSLFLSGSVIDVPKGKTGNGDVWNRSPDGFMEGPERKAVAVIRPRCRDLGGNSLREQAARPGIPHHAADGPD